jgi:SAM-dependent methyltransferase
MSGRPPGIFQSTEVADARWQQTLWPDPAFVVAAVGIIDGMDVIDLCCDDGWLTLAIAKIAQHVTAVSNDAGMLGLTCIRMNENRIFNCAYQLADARELADFAAKPVDFIFMANSFHRVGDRISLSRAVGETLRPGGHFAIVNWRQLPREQTTVRGQPCGPRSELRLSPEKTIKVVEAGGLKSKTIVELPPYHYGAIFEKPVSIASAAGRTRPA